MNIWSLQFFWPYFSTSEKDLNGGSNIVLCDAGAMLHQLNYEDNWDLVFTWFHDWHRSIYTMLTPEFYVLELQIEMHVNDLRSFLALLLSSAKKLRRKKEVARKTRKIVIHKLVFVRGCERYINE